MSPSEGPIVHRDEAQEVRKLLATGAKSVRQRQSFSQGGEQARPEAIKSSIAPTCQTHDWPHSRNAKYPAALIMLTV